MAASGPKYPNIEVQLTGQDGNAMNLMAIVGRALRHHGHGHEVDEFIAEAMSGDYGTVIATCGRWVSIS